jgi:hypothetical protein
MLFNACEIFFTTAIIPFYVYPFANPFNTAYPKGRGGVGDCMAIIQFA